MRQVITVVVVFFAIQHSFSQSYTSVLVNLQNAIKERQVIAAKVVFSVADEDGDKRLTKFIYADNRATPWRAMYIPELQKTIYFDGINKTFSFFHSIKKMEVHEDIMAIYEMKKNLDVLSQVLMTRKESNVTEIDSTAIHYVIPRGEGKVDLVAIFKGDIGLNIKNKT